MRVYLWFGLLCCAALFAGGEGDEPGNTTEGAPETIAETITVTAERAPVKLKESTAKVSVIDERQINEQVIQDARDLVRYEPGVYVEGDVTRLGLNGFNIRGIGGNRVLTQIDGVRTAEQFDFGPFNVHQYSVDVDMLKSVEIVRSAASSLYGSDALGGVVSFVTKDPEDFLRGESQAFQVKPGYNGATESTNLGLVGAFESGRFQGMVSATRRDFGERQNQGTIGTFDATRTEPNEIDGQSLQIMAKGVWNASPDNRFKFTAEWFDSDVDTHVFSGQGVSNQLGAVTEISNNTANDLQERLRVSIEQELRAKNGFFDLLTWQIYMQENTTDQSTAEQRNASRGPVTTRIFRTGEVDFEQETVGAELMLQKTYFAGETSHRLSYGVEYSLDDFGQFRDRRDLDLDTGNPDAYAGPLTFPTRYFPFSEVTETGVFIQSESLFFDDRLRLTPGLRYDRYELDPDQNDVIFNESTGAEEAPAALDDDSVSPKLGIAWLIGDHVTLTGHYAQGFRAPPHSSVNSGFTNLAGGYQTLPNPNLDPETSDNLEFGFKTYNKRGSLSVTYFDNEYEDFIDSTAFVGVSQTGILLFQAQNLQDVAISGLELAGDYRFTDHWSTRFSFADIEGEDQATDTPINSIEPRKGVLGFGYRDSENRFSGELIGTFISAKDRDDVAFDGDPFLTDSTQLVDLVFNYRFTQDIALYVGGFNLTDETYYQWSEVIGRNAASPTIERYTSPGRYFSVNLNFQW